LSPAISITHRSFMKAHGSRHRWGVACLIVGAFCLLAGATAGKQNIRPEKDSLAAQLLALDSNIFPARERRTLARMLSDDVRARRDAANQRDAQAWARVTSRAAWERFRAVRLEALRRSLGRFPPAPKPIRAYVTRTIEGDGYRIENAVYESRAGVFVTANLYLPSAPRGKMPAIILIHSHHNPKTQDELQDMGMTWARQGCAVLVMDQLSHGERRQHPPGRRQDYRFRYINGIQLDLIGDSLMGWMAWDVMRGVDLLLGRAEIDPEKVILIGSVAGGGDPAAVVAALDSRIACVVPFNFGGPQPESPYPLPADAEKTFNYMGDGSWESTRNLRWSGRDGFLPWAIVGSAAPRRLIYAHEFSWDKERDPVWRRLQKIFGFYGAPAHIAFAHGAGVLSGRPPEATHCNNVGAVHRKMIYPALRRWFGTAVPEREYQERRPAEDLISLTPEWSAKLRPRPLHEIFGEIGASRAAAMRAQLGKLTRGRKGRLRQAWTRLLGDIEPKTVSEISNVKSQISTPPSVIQIERIVLEVEPKIVVPVLLLLPAHTGDKKLPVVVASSQEGKAKFLSQRADEIAELLRRGVAVCLPDVRGSGETSPDWPRDGWNEGTAEGIHISSTEAMLGQTLLGSRLRDVRSVLRYLGRRPDLDAKRIALWGDSFAPANPQNFTDPLLGEGAPPQQSEPLGGLLALLGALYEDGVRAVVARRTLAGYQSVLRDRFCYVPHDAIVPGALTAGDLGDVAAVLAPRPLRLEGLVDGRNRVMALEDVQQIFEPTLQAYRATANKLLLAPADGGNIADWLVKSLTSQ